MILGRNTLFVALPNLVVSDWSHRARASSVLCQRASCHLGGLPQAMDRGCTRYSRFQLMMGLFSKKCHCQRIYITYHWPIKGDLYAKRVLILVPANRGCGMDKRPSPLVLSALMNGMMGLDCESGRSFNSRSCYAGQAYLLVIHTGGIGRNYLQGTLQFTVTVEWRRAEMTRRRLEFLGKAGPRVFHGSGVGAVEASPSLGVGGYLSDRSLRLVGICILFRRA